MARADQAAGSRRWPWRRQQQPPAWPTPQTGRPTWAAEQQQLLPAVRPAIEPVIRECDG